MSTITIANLPRITPTSLASLIHSSSPVTIIDVRDSDFIGGHIKNCLHIPVAELDWKLPELVRKLKGEKVVVFHCALSQQRGPGSALRYLRERERVGEKEGVQEVFVLEGGFVRWQELYGQDENLTEGYQKDIWEFGY